MENLKDNVRGKLMGPAISLLIVTGLSILYWLFSILMGMVGMASSASNPDLQEAEELMGPGFVTAVQGGSMAVSVAFLLLQLVVLIGAIRMLQVRSWGLCLAACIVAVVPCVSPCLILGIPFGIWGLVVLMREDVKLAMREG
jgi:hypothetical protein